MVETWKQYVDHPEKNPFHMKFTKFNTTMRISSLYRGGIPDSFHPELKDKNTFLRQILWRKEIGMNTFIACLGNVRTSKSYFCLKYGELYSNISGQDFDVKEQCSFSDILHFLRWSQTAQDSAYVLDEIQIGMSPREWYNIQHRVMNQFCDIQGWRRNLLLMPFPNISYIDKHLRFLLNYVCRTLSQGVVLWWKVNTRHELGKTWLVPLGSIKFKLPTQKTIEEYERKKKIFTDEHLKDSIDLMELAGSPNEKEKLRLEYWQLRNQDIKSRIARRKHLSSDKKEVPMGFR